MQKRQCHRFAAFTLVELLVVVSIIALLISILLPSLGKARQQARTAACAANLHQIGIGLTAYVLETRHYPGHHGIRPIAVAWPARIRKYLSGNVDVFWCSSNELAARWTPTFGSAGARARGYGYDPGENPIRNTTWFSYGYNDWGVAEFVNPHLGLGGHLDDPGSSHSAELKETLVKVPADMIAIADAKSDGIWDTAIDPADSRDDEWPSRRHAGGSNVLFCDGHVVRMSQDSLVEPTDWARRRWNNDHQPHNEYW